MMDCANDGHVYSIVPGTRTSYQSINYIYMCVCVCIGKLNVSILRFKWKTLQLRSSVLFCPSGMVNEESQSCSRKNMIYRVYTVNTSEYLIM